MLPFISALCFRALYQASCCL